MNTSKTKPTFNDYDTSGLNEMELKAFEEGFKPNKYSFFAAVFLAITSATIIPYIFNNDPVNYAAVILLIIKVIGFLFLGYWSRSKIRIAALLLLAWHIYFNYQFIFSDSLRFKMHFWIPGAIFAWGCIQAIGQHGLQQKTKLKTEQIKD